MTEIMDGYQAAHRLLSGKHFFALPESETTFEEYLGGKRVSMSEQGHGPMTYSDAVDFVAAYNQCLLDGNVKALDRLVVVFRFMGEESA